MDDDAPQEIKKKLLDPQYPAGVMAIIIDTAAEESFNKIISRMASGQNKNIPGEITFQKQRKYEKTGGVIVTMRSICVYIRQ